MLHVYASFMFTEVLRIFIFIANVISYKYVWDVANM